MNILINESLSVSESRPLVRRLPFFVGAEETGNSFFKSVDKTKIPGTIKRNAEKLSGLDLGDVTVHYNSPEPVKAEALAYTKDNEIHLAAGQEKYLAHETWHAVQQKEGRVNPTSTLAPDTFVNEDSGLENEADQMASKLVSGNASEYAKNNQPSNSTSSGQSVMQRKKVKTDFGTFETTNFGVTTGGIFGVDITLEFDPDESKVDAKKIALSQAVRSTTSNGQAYAMDPDQDAKMVAAGKPGAGYSIDVPATSNNPIYSPASLGPKQELKDSPESENKTSNAPKVGTNTNFLIGYCFKEKPSDKKKKKQLAGLVDKPLSGNLPGQSKMFETVAFATDGKDKGKYYGSVKWGFKIDGTVSKPKITPIDIDQTTTSKQTPSVNFSEAAKLWNTGKTEGTLRVAVDPANVMKGDLSDPKSLKPDTLPKGTKLKQLENLMVGDDPSIHAEVLKKDDKGTGTFIYIKNSDVEDAGGGISTKKLP